MVHGNMFEFGVMWHTHACTSHIQCSSSPAPVSKGERRLCWQAWEVLMVIVGVGVGGMERHWWW